MDRTQTRHRTVNWLLPISEVPVLQGQVRGHHRSGTTAKNRYLDPPVIQAGKDHSIVSKYKLAVLKMRNVWIT